MKFTRRFADLSQAPTSLWTNVKDARLMNKMDAFRQAVAEIGDAPPEALSFFVKQKYGVTIDPRVIPVFLASLRDLETLNRLRQAARAARQPSDN